MSTGKVSLVIGNMVILKGLPVSMLTLAQWMCPGRGYQAVHGMPSSAVQLPFTTCSHNLHITSAESSPSAYIHCQTFCAAPTVYACTDVL